MRVRLIATNALFNALSLAVSSLAAVLLMPFLLRWLGERLFGVWALLGVVITVAQLLDLGLGRALVRNVAGFHAQGQWSELWHDFNRMVGLLLGMWLGLAWLGWLLAPFVARLLGVPSAELAQAVSALRLLFLSFVPVGFSLLLVAVWEGVQKMAVSSGIQALTRLIFATGAVFAVVRGWGVVGVAGAYLLSVMIQSLFLLLLAFWRLPALKLRPRLGRCVVSKGEVGFGVNVLAVGVIALAFTAMNKVALARWLGLSALAYYELANVIALQLFAFALASARALYPALATALVVGGLSDARKLFRQSLRLQVMVISPVVAVMIVLARPGMVLWLGQDLAEPGRILQWLMLAWGVAAVASLASVGFLALARPHWPTFFSALNLLVNGLLLLLLIPRWHLEGVVAANVVAVGGSSLLTLWLFLRLLEEDMRAVGAAIMPLLLWALGLGMVVGFWGQRHPPQTWSVLVMFAGSYGLLYGGGLLGLGLLRPEERTWLHNLRARLSWQGRRE